MQPLPARHVVCFQIRVLGGTSSEPADQLGLARVVTEVLDKGTAKRTGRELLDAFDTLGASHNAGTGRETATFTCTTLPEHFEQALALHTEMLRTPTFPQDAFEIGIELTRQELLALEDDAQGLVDKLLNAHVFGPILGRHTLGERATLDRLTRDDLQEFWRSHFQAGRMLVAVAGAVEPERVRSVLEEQFAGFGSPTTTGRSPFAVEFDPGVHHHPKELEQVQIGVGWPGVDVTHDDYPVQKVLLGLLSGGMSARLFTELREKQGLVYWVGAWHEAPRGAGMIMLGASTRPERCGQTYEALLREVDRLAEDLTPQELQRAITGIVAGQHTRGDGTLAHCGRLANDLFFFGKPIPLEQKLDQVRAVTLENVARYIDKYPRDRRAVVTLGPQALPEA